MYPSFGASFEEIQDLEDVDLLGLDDEQEEEEYTFLERCNIVGVKELDNVYACISCKQAIKAETTDTNATCNNCNTRQLLKQAKQVLNCSLNPKVANHSS